MASRLVVLAVLVVLLARVHGQTSRVLSMWSGALTENSIRISYRVASRDDGPKTRLLVSNALETGGFTRPAPTPNFASTVIPSSPYDNGVTFQAVVTGLTENTRYYYAVTVDGEVVSNLGQFVTSSANHLNFTFAVGSCADTGSNHEVFEAIESKSPLFFLHTGDLHYANIGENDPDRYREAFDQVLAAPRQNSLYRSVPLAYVWDDHDFGPNDADRTNPGRPAARLVYQEYVPHYPLAAGSGADVPIYQSWWIGRVRFIMTDLRSEKDPASNSDGPSKTTMGATQKQWLKNELLAAKAADAVRIVWVISNIWIGTFPDDSFSSYEDERREISTFILQNDINNLFVVSGDTHMVAFDDGEHNRYAEGQKEKGFPVFQAAPLDRRPSKKGGPYSHGCFAKRGQFGLVTVTTNMDLSSCVLFEGFNGDNDRVFSYDTCDPSPEDLCTPLDLVVFVSVVGVIVAIAVVGILCCVAFCLFRRWRRRKQRTHELLEEREPMREFTNIDRSDSESTLTASTDESSG